MIKKKKEWVSQETKLATAETLLFAPAVIFWVSAMVYVGMGTDYVFDVIVLPASRDWLGMALILIVIAVLPGLGALGAWMMWKNFGNKLGKPLLIIGGLMAAAGILCSVIRI